MGRRRCGRQPAAGSYHQQPSIENGLKAIPAALQTTDGSLNQCLEYLSETYKFAADRAEQVALPK